NNIFTIKADSTSTVSSLQRTSSPDSVFEGGFSGRLVLNAGEVAQITHAPALELTADNKTYIELNYRNSMSFQLGFIALCNTGYDYQEYYVGFKPKSTWNKVYIEMQSFVSAHPNSTYLILLRATPEDGQSSGYVLLDNIKVITFK